MVREKGERRRERRSENDREREGVGEDENVFSLCSAL